MFLIDENPSPEFRDFLQGMQLVNYLVEVESDRLELSSKVYYRIQKSIQGFTSILDINGFIKEDTAAILT